MRIEQPRGGMGSVQVMAQCPGEDVAAGGVVIAVGGQFGGVGAQQVMQGVAARGVLGDQLRCGELI